jgi:transposase
VISSKRVHSIWEYGNAALLDYAMQDLKPLLQNAFGEIWEEVYALALIRIAGYVPLKRANITWEKLFPIAKITPTMNAKALSKVLKEVGADRKGQNQVFKGLKNEDKHLIYDLSVIFTRSEAINFAEKGYNKEHFHIQQVNFALFCTANDNLPTMLRVLPGSVRDIKSLALSVHENGAENKTLIFDRGFYSQGSIKTLNEHKLSFIIPTKRNSTLYNEQIKLSEHFFYHERLIKCGKKKHGENILYLFEDDEMKKEEEYTLYKQHDENKITSNTFNKGLEKAGKILLISNVDLAPKDVFLIYKKRDTVEKHYDTYKSILEADKLYLQDNESLFGHLFVSFLSLYGYVKIQNCIRKADLTSKYSPRDLIEQFRKVYVIDLDGQMILTEVPKQIGDIEKKLKLDLFPK